MQLKPIGYMQSVFKYKNGTPRQPMLCENARGILQIEKSIFNNPEHSLEELDKFSHVWIVFIFHKNSSSVSKAKVKPPRLDGRKVGVFSTRSPHRPNPIGLTLARLDKVEGSCIHLSGIDILDGTPILDVKPYIQEYDSPVWKSGCPRATSQEPHDIDRFDIEGSAAENTNNVPPETTDNIETTLCAEDVQLPREEKINMESKELLSGDLRLNEFCQQSMTSGQCQGDDKLEIYELTDSHKRQGCPETNPNRLETVCVNDADGENFDHQKVLTSFSHISNTEVGLKSCVSSSSDNISTNEKVQLNNADCLKGLKTSTNDRTDATKISSSWIPDINIKLHVRFTERAESQLKLFSKQSLKPDYKLTLIEDCSELRHSIVDILSEDPRSVYRRHKCQDSLYYFTVDQAHVTCWFDSNTVEIVRVQSIDMVKQLLER